MRAIVRGMDTAVRLLVSADVEACEMRREEHKMCMYLQGQSRTAGP